MNPPDFSKSADRLIRGFSIIELLMVIAIVSVLASVSALSISGIAGAAHLSTGGAQISNFLESAREMSILKKTPVAVALLAKGDDVGSRIMTALEYLPDANQWVRISKWETLPKGVMVDMTAGGTNNTFVPGNSPTISPALPNLVYASNTYSPQLTDGYGYIVFLPNGSLYQSGTQPSVFRLVEGVSTSTGSRYTGAKDANGNPVNYFEIVINESTGRVKMARSE